VLPVVLLKLIKNVSNNLVIKIFYYIGSPGCGQEEVALKLSKEYNICYVNFRQRLHELMKARYGRDLGPNKTPKIVDRNKSEKRIAEAKSKDDMLKEKEVRGESPVESVEEEEDDDDEGIVDSNKKITTIHPILLETKSDELKIDEAALRSLGLLDTADLKTVPIGNIERTERLTGIKIDSLTFPKSVSSLISPQKSHFINLPHLKSKLSFYPRTKMEKTD
jgi:hypothetical protein